MAKRFYLFLLTLIMSVTTLQLAAQDSLTVADGNVTNTYVPVYGYYMDYYNRSQMIFPESMLQSMAGSEINAMTFYLSFGPTSSWTSNFNVKLGICPETTFPSNAFLAHPTQTVYTGTLTVANDQLTITFATPFTYSGGNLLVEFATQTPGNYSSSIFLGISSNNSSISGASNNDIASITPGRRDFLPKTTFVYTSGTVTCSKPNTFTASNITTHEALLTWTPSGNETNWDLYITESSTFPGNSTTPTTTVTDTTYSLTGLTSATTYYAYVRANCGSEQSIWKSLTFQTLCDSIFTLPFADGFDTYGTGQGTYPTCWSKINTYTNADWPYISAVNYEGNGSLYFYAGNNGTYNIAITPAFSQNIPINTLQADFMFRGSSHVDRIIVGVMSDPTDAATFVPVDTVFPDIPSDTWVEQTVIFSEYTGTGHHIAFKNEYNTIQTYAYIDNLSIDLIPACPKPQFVTLSNVTDSGCNVSWTPMGNETSWEVVAVFAGTDVQSGTPLPASAIPFTLTNLTDDTQYDVYVRANCGDSHSPWSLSATFTTHPLCAAPLSVGVDQITGTSAMVTWESAPYGATGYKVGYSLAGQSVWTTQSVTGNQLILSGLTPSTTYDVMVISECLTNISDTVFVQFTTSCLSGGDVHVGNGTSTSYLLPLNNYYNYSYSQQIFLASEMGGAGTIDSIAFEYAYIVSSYNKNNVSIYLGHTNKNSFANASDYVSLSSLQLVYTGNLNCHQGWNTFVFNTPFQYNGTDNLVLVVDDNSGSSNGNSHTFYVHHTNESRAVYYYSDTYNPNPANPLSGSPISAVVFNRNNVRFFIPCDNTISCIAPNAYVSGIGENSLTVTWAPGNTETSWEMQYCTEAGSWISEGNVTSPHTISNLVSDTKYSIRLRSICGGGEYSSWTNLEERTACSTVSIPFTEDFEDAPGTGADHMITCWTTGTNYGSTYPYLSASQHHSGNNSVYFYATSAYYSYLATPQFTSETDMHNLQIRFWAYKTAPNYYIQVGVMTDPDDYSTFVQIGQDFTPSTNSTWELFEVNTDSYTGNGRYIAFRAPNNITDYIYIDDVTVDSIPACQHVSNIAVDPASMTSNSASLTWTAGGTESQWEVVYGLAGTIINPDLATPMTVDTPAVTLLGLSASSAYDVFVKAQCSASESSSWVLYTFNTACGAISVLPYSENFDYMGSGASAFPICWVRHNTFSTTTNYPYVSSYFHNSGNASLYFYNSTSTYSMAVLPAINVTAHPINTLQVSFMMRSTSSITSAIQVGIMTDASNPATFVPVETLHNTTTGTFEYKEVPLSNYTGNGTYIALKMINTSSTYSVYLDDLMVELQPTCKKPFSLTVSNVNYSEADLSWTSTSTNPAGFNIVISDQPSFNPDTCTTVFTSTTPSYHFFNLQAHTTYYVRVRTDCGDGDHSVWSEVQSFTTLPGVPANLPYFSDFSNYNEISNWVLVNTTTINKWYISQPNENDHNILYVSSDNGATATYDNSECKIWAFRDFVFPTAAEYEISFKWRCQGESSYDYMYAFLGDPATVEASINSTVTAPAGSIQLGGTNHKFNQNSEWTWFYQSIDSTIGSGIKRLYFVWRNDVSVQNDPAIMIDSIFVKALSCGHPTDLTVTNTTATSADFTFSKSHPDDIAWEYVVCDADANVNNETPIAISDTVFSVSNLEGGTNYEIYVRTSCGNNDYSSWTSLPFATECVAITSLPYSEGFDDYGTGIGTYPNCWSKINTHTSDRPHINSTHYEGVGSLYFYAGNPGTYNIAIMPEIDTSISINTLKANFMYRAYKTTDMLIVGVMSSTTDVSTFVAVDTIYPADPVSTWVAKEVSFSSYTGNGRHIAFRNNFTSDIAYAFIDNLVITQLEVCEEPTGLSVNIAALNEQSYSVTVQWDNNPDVESWVLQYAKENDEWTTITTTGNFYLVENLLYNWTYNYRVKAVCDSEIGNTSEWSDPVDLLVYIDGIDDHLANSISLYPNPAREVIHVQCTMNNVQIESIEVFDVYGKLLQTVSMTPETNTINVSNLAAGIYFVRVTADGARVTKSFVKK